MVIPLNAGPCHAIPLPELTADASTDRCSNNYCRSYNPGDEEPEWIAAPCLRLLFRAISLENVGCDFYHQILFQRAGDGAQAERSHELPFQSLFSKDQ